MIFRYTFLFIFSYLLIPTLLAQKNDYNWHSSYGNDIDDPLDSIRGKTILNFNSSLSNKMLYYNPNSIIDYDITNASISDEEGNFLFTYNGVYIEDASDNVMLNGEEMSDSGNIGGDVLSQGGLILPLPESENTYILFHESWDYIGTFGTAGHKLYYSIIDMEENDGLGAVVDKRNLLLTDTLDYGKLTATKHANGRDWWIIFPRYDNDEYYSMVLTPSGPEVLGIQSTDVIHRAGLGQAHFSPDGTKYANFSAISEFEGNFLHFYNFDRCTGLLSTPQIYHYDYDIGANGLGGISISPNSAILYLMAYDEIYQFDLNANNIIASKLLVAERDDYLDTIPGPNGYVIPHHFFTAQLAPDGKIYVCSFASLRVFTTIDYPDIWGESCQVNQHSVHLPTICSSVPNFPNYRLGPIDGSVCDSLGIDNMPLSRFRGDQDSLDFLNFQFVDLSNYEPIGWSWDFGDESTSSDINPIHVFQEAGVYEVCLTVSNDNGSHTSCETFYIGVSAITDLNPEIQLSLFPNPCQDFFNIDLVDYYPQNAVLLLYNSQGKLVKEQRIFHGLNYVKTSYLTTGMYFYSIVDGGLVIKSGKIFKQ